MHLRPYRDSDAAASRRVFERAVHVTAAGDYTDLPREAWAPNLDALGLQKWTTARARAHTIVAVDEDEVAGFSDLVDGTPLDMLYVDPHFARRGIGCALISEIVRLARSEGASRIETESSVTARPVFERQGFAVVARQAPVIRGVAMTNFKMRLDLDGA